MSGFLGIYRPCTTPDQILDDENLIRSELAGITPRGPDGTRIERFGRLVLGTSRLTMAGNGHGGQPTMSSDARVVVALNGEIYDHARLRARLVRQSYEFATDDSDTGTLCGLLSVSGPSALSEVDGQYAIAAYYPDDGRLVLIRDRFGVHPLFYTRVRGSVIFGSSARAVARLGRQGAAAPEAIFLTLSLWGTPDPLTPYRNVFSVRPGYLVECSQTQAVERAVDPITFPPAGTEEPLDEEDLVGAFDDAVASRLQTDVDLGLLVSGGVDSGSVAQAASLAGWHLPAYVLASEPDAANQAAQARRVVEACGHRLNAVPLGRSALAEHLVRTVRTGDIPLWRTGPIGFDVLAAAVRADGVKGLLAGDGADELFCGYDLFQLALARMELGAEDSVTRSAGLIRLRHVPSTRGLIRGQRPPHALAPYASTDVLHSHLPRWRLYAGSALRLFAPDLRDLLNAFHPTRYLRDTLGAELVPLSALNRARLLELRTLLQGFLLSAQGDRPFMAHGIQMRYPFLSRRVADLAIRADPRAFVTPTVGKVPVRRCLAGRVDPALASTPKAAYDAGPLSDCGPLREICEEYLSARAVSAQGIFDPARVTPLATALCQGKSMREVDAAMLLGVLSTQVMFDD